MDLIKRIPDIRGCYLLTPTGTLGRYQDNGQFQLDDALTRALAVQIDKFLDEYRKTQDTRWCRLGLVHTDHEGKPWHSATLALADDALRRLYPMSGSRDGRMTTFQLRNREQSLYRGLELLLGYRDPALPDVVYYCPVLLYRNTTLDQYLPWPERPRRDSDNQTPVVEVIDLLGGLARSQRHVPEAEQLVANLRRAVVRPERRSAPTLVLIDDVRRTLSSPPEVAPVDPYAGEEDPQVLREFESRYAATHFSDFDYRTWFEAHAPVESRERFGKQLAAASGYPHRAADDLRFFERLEGCDRAALLLIASKSPVFRVPPGTRLLDVGTRDNWNLYLLSGELELVSPDGARYRVAGGSPSASRPVAFLKPRLFSVTAHTEVEFLWLYEPMVEAVKRLYPGAAQTFRPSTR